MPLTHIDALQTSRSPCSSFRVTGRGLHSCGRGGGRGVSVTPENRCSRFHWPSFDRKATCCSAPCSENAPCRVEREGRAFRLTETRPGIHRSAFHPPICLSYSSTAFHFLNMGRKKLTEQEVWRRGGWQAYSISCCLLHPSGTGRLAKAGRRRHTRPSGISALSPPEGRPVQYTLDFDQCSPSQAPQGLSRNPQTCPASSVTYQRVFFWADTLMGGKKPFP